MKVLVLIIISIVILVIICGIILSAIQLKNINQTLTKNIGEHVVEVTIKYTNCFISIDKKVVDQVSSYKMNSCKLTAKLDDLDIVVNIGSGFLKPKIITFINGTKDTDLSNC